MPNYGAHFPVIVKSGTNQAGRQIDFIFNYSDDQQSATIPAAGTELIADQMVNVGDQLSLEPWAVKIIEEEK